MSIQDDLKYCERLMSIGWSQLRSAADHVNEVRKYNINPFAENFIEQVENKLSEEIDEVKVDGWLGGGTDTV